MIQSIAIILIVGIVGSMVLKRISLPGLLGMMIMGVLIGPYGFDLLDVSIMDNAVDIRMMALIVILLRAGLGLNKEVLKSVGTVAIKMSAIPCLLEGFTVTVVAYYILDLPMVEAGMLGFIIAAVSPAVIVPSMLHLKEKGWGMDKGIPVIVLAGASVDDVFAITLFTAFLGMGLKARGSIALQIGLIPLQIVAGIVLGLVVSYLLYKIFKMRKVTLSSEQRMTFVVVAAFAILIIGERYHIAGLLGIMTVGFVLLEKSPEIASKLEGQLGKVWFFAQIFLFVLIGAQVDIYVAWQAGLAGIMIIACGLIARITGVFISLHGSALNHKEKLFCAIAYTPKATVQAAIGGIPLAMGIASGAVILAIAVLAVMVTAPLGAIGIHAFAPRLLKK